MVLAGSFEWTGSRPRLGERGSIESLPCKFIRGGRSRIHLITAGEVCRESAQDVQLRR